MRTRRTLRGHLAKIYAMHWGIDSRYELQVAVGVSACAVHRLNVSNTSHYKAFNPYIYFQTHCQCLSRWKTHFVGLIHNK